MTFTDPGGQPSEAWLQKERSVLQEAPAVVNAAGFDTCPIVPFSVVATGPGLSSIKDIPDHVSFGDGQGFFGIAGGDVNCSFVDEQLEERGVLDLLDAQGAGIAAVESKFRSLQENGGLVTATPQLFLGGQVLMGSYHNFYNAPGSRDVVVYCSLGSLMLIFQFPNLPPGYTDQQVADWFSSTFSALATGQ